MIGLLKNYCSFANQVEGKIEMNFQYFVQSPLAAQKRDLAATSQMLLAGVNCICD